MGLLLEKIPVNLQGVTLVVCLSAVGVLADAFLKMASEQPASFANRHFFAGSLIYGLSGFAWVMAMKHLKLAAIGAIYGVATAVLLALVGVLFFKESLNVTEVLGIIFGVTSVLLLARFS